MRPTQFPLHLIVSCSLLAGACSSDSGFPTSPSPVGDASASGATVQGQVRSLGGESLPIGLTVSVVGTEISVDADSEGRFTLENVPPGPVALRFSGPGVDAQLDIGVVAAGERVEVEVAVSGSNAVLEGPPDSNDEVHVEGAVTGLGGACPNVTFRVGGVLVRTSAATRFDDGGCGAIDNGDQVRVDGFQQPDGSVQATEVEVDVEVDDDGGPGSDDPGGGNGSTEVHIEGAVSGLGGACPSLNFRVDGVLIRTSAATTFDDGGCGALNNRDQVRIDGFQQPDGSVQATEVEVDESGDDGGSGSDGSGDGDADTEVHVEGAITGLGGACPSVTFRVGGVSIRTSAATTFDDGGCAALNNGDQVRVDGFQQPDGSVEATEVEVDQAADDDPSPISLDLEIDPDEWRLEWVDGSQSGGGGDTVRIRIRGPGADQIDPDTVEMSGPGGIIQPVTTDIGGDFRAEFRKVDAIALVGDAEDGDSVRITVRGQMNGGSPFSLARDVLVRE